MLTLHILGSNSALAAYGRNPTAQVLQTDEGYYLIDCGEGTQNQLTRYNLKWNKISHVFISHLHGDHYFGLIGLLTSMSLLGRTAHLHVFGPARLKEIIDLQFEVSGTILPYALYFHALGNDGEIANSEKMSVSCFRVSHRIDCWGFLFREKKPFRKVNAEAVKSYGVPQDFLRNVQQGEDYVTAKGTIIPNSELTLGSVSPGSYAYSADTVYTTLYLDKIRGVDLLYHEATYLKDNAHKALARFHCTAEQAAQTAKDAGVKKLLLGHFSSRYAELDAFLEEAREVFENTALAVEGQSYQI